MSASSGSGCVANFTASRVSTERVRELRFFQAGQYISIDYGRQDVLVFSVSPASDGTHPNVAKDATLGGAPPVPPPPAPLAPIRRSQWLSLRLRRRSRCWRRSRHFCSRCGSGRFRWFRWRMGGERWSWGWRFLGRLGGTRGGSGWGDCRELRVRLQRLNFSNLTSDLVLELGWWWGLLVASGGRAVVVALSPLLTFGLHFVPVFLLGRVEESSDLRVAGLVDVHHFGVAILLGKRRVLGVQGLHLGVFGLEDVLHFGLLIGGELEFPGQFLGALGRIGGAVVPATVGLCGGLSVGRLGCRERRGDGNEAGREKNEKGLL